MKGHHGAQVFIAVSGIENVPPHSIQHAARPHHVSPTLALGKDARRIRKVHKAGSEAKITKSCNSILESKNLIVRQGFAGGFVSSSEVRHQAIDANVLKLPQLR